MKTIFSQKKGNGSRQRGFTLVEMIVAVGLFAVVMLVAIGALLSLVNANRKAQALQSVINNLNVAVDGMVRPMREGTNYRCNGNSSAPDCPTTGGTSFYFTPYCPTGPCADWIFWWATDANGIGRIYKSEDGIIADGLPITAPEVVIDSATFYVIGATRGDAAQPKVMIVIKGEAGNTNATVHTTFHIQSTAVQRVLDI